MDFILNKKFKEERDTHILFRFLRSFSYEQYESSFNRMHLRDISAVAGIQHGSRRKVHETFLFLAQRLVLPLMYSRSLGI